MDEKLRQEKSLIKKALVLNWDCEYCKKLGFNITACEHDKDSCADILYRNLRQHFFHVIKAEYSGNEL